MTEPLRAPEYLSPSSIDTFKQCPLKFKFSRIDRLVDEPTEATVLGSFVHAVLEDLYALPAAERTLSASRSIMSAQWEKEWGAHAAAVLRGKEKAMHAFRWNAWWCIENYFKLENPTAIEPEGIEYELNSHINDVPVRGFIDRWHLGDEGVVISDYKTGKTPRPPYVDGKFFQLILYADVLCSTVEKPLERVELLYLKDGVKLQRSMSEEVQQSIASMRQTVVETNAAVKERCERGEFEPTPNKLCDWCSYKSICPAWTKETK